MTDAAQTVLSIFRDYLQEPEMAADDDFYAMGGDSLIGLKVVARARELGVPVNLRDLLYYPTARGLASAVAARADSAPDRASDADGASDANGISEAGGASRERGSAAEDPFSLLSPLDRAMVPGGAAAAWPASSLQLGLLYECESTRDPRLYHDLIGLEVSGPFDEALFAGALRRLCERHEALRTSFDLGAFTEPVQLVWPAVQLPLTVERASDSVTRWRRERLESPIDWGQAPLFACHVGVLPASFHLTLAFHHAIIDGWSLSRLVTELLLIYDAALSGREAGLPRPAVHGYREFLALERAAVSEKAAADFWHAEADVPPLLFRRERFGGTADPVQSTGFRLEASQLERLRDAAAKAELPLKSVVFGCHVAALGQWTGRQQDVVTGLTVNGRPEVPGADLLVGLFLNTVPVRFATTSSGFLDLGRAALAAEQRTYSHRRYPLARIEQRLGRPAFDVSFNFTHFHSYTELERLRELRPVSWWSFDKASLPVMVDFMIDSRGAGTGVTIAFDPSMISRDQADELSRIYQQSLSSAGVP